jgi:hypothetical protein
MIIKIVIVRCQRQAFPVDVFAIINVAIVSVVVVFVVIVSHIDDEPDWHVHVVLLRVHSVLIGVYTGAHLRTLSPEIPLYLDLSSISLQHEWGYTINL